MIVKSRRLLIESFENYYERIKKISEKSKNIVWVNSGAPIELLEGCNLVPLIPEHYMALCSIMHRSIPLLKFSESLGYSKDLCSVARNTIGSISLGEKSPLGGVSKPSMLLCSNNLCITIQKWYEAIRDMLEVPLFMLDMPSFLSKHTIDYVELQIEKCIDFITNITGEKFSEEHLKNVLSCSNEVLNKWSEILKMCRNIPSPLNCSDRFEYIAPILTRRGNKNIIEFYKDLHSEVLNRVRRGIGAIDDERIRLLWAGFPIWFELPDFFYNLASKGISFPADTYTSIWTLTFDTCKPLRSIAENYIGLYNNNSIDMEIEKICKMIKEYRLDGFIMHSNRSCKRYSIGQLVIKREVTSKTGVPGLLIEADQCDRREYQDVFAKRIDPFLELLN